MGPHPPLLVTLVRPKRRWRRAHPINAQEARNACAQANQERTGASTCAAANEAAVLVLLARFVAGRRKLVVESTARAAPSASNGVVGCLPRHWRRRRRRHVGHEVVVQAHPQLQPGAREVVQARRLLGRSEQPRRTEIVIGSATLLAPLAGLLRSCLAARQRRGKTGRLGEQSLLGSAVGDAQAECTLTELRRCEVALTVVPHQAAARALVLPLLEVVHCAKGRLSNTHRRVRTRMHCSSAGPWGNRAG